MKLNISVDNLLIYDVEFQYFADRFVKEIGSNCAVHAVKTMADLAAAILKHNAVKFLEICLHGSPGRLYMDNKKGIDGNVISLIAAANPIFLKRNARILFDSCQIGQGEIGDKFMDSIGAGMLKGKGGIVGATTVFNHTYPLRPWVTGAHMLTGGILKVKKYDESGKLVATRSVDEYGFAM